MSSLLQSRKFWLLVADTVISTVLFYLGKTHPEWIPDVEQLIAIYQPVFVMLIYAIAKEDAAEKGRVIVDARPEE